MLSVQTPDFKLTIGTLDFSTEPLKQRVNEITVELVSDGAGSFKIILDDSDGRFTQEDLAKTKYTIDEGMECKIQLGFAEKEKPVKPVMNGIITGLTPKRKEFSRKVLEITGFDNLSKLSRGRKRRSWENIKDSDIASQIAGECGLATDIEDSKIVNPFVVQNNENNLAFLFERARRLGFEIKVKDMKMTFRKPREIDSGIILRGDGVSVQKKGGIVLQRMDFNTSTMNMPQKVIVRSYNPGDATPIVGTATTITGEKMGGKRTAAEAAQAGGNPDTTIQVSDQPVASQEEADTLAQSILDQRAGEFMTGNGRCEGTPDIIAGVKVKIEDVGESLKGEYYVTNAKHVLRVGHGQGFGYWTEFSVSRTGR